MYPPNPISYVDYLQSLGAQVHNKGPCIEIDKVDDEREELSSSSPASPSGSLVHSPDHFDGKPRLLPSSSDYQTPADVSMMDELGEGNPLFLRSVRPRRSRTTFSTYQLHVLEAAFLKNHYPDIALRDHLAQQLKLSDGRVQVSTSRRKQ